MLSNAIQAGAVSRITGVQTLFKDLRGGITLLPQRIAMVGQGNTTSVYPLTKLQVTSALEVANVYGFGCPLHLAARQFFPVNGDGIGIIPLTIYPMVDDGSGVAATGDITPVVGATEAAAFLVRVNNIESAQFVINIGDTVANVVASITTAINGQLAMPIIATDATTVVNFAAKWAGSSSNDIVVEIVGATNVGNTFAVTQANGGLVNPDVDPALTLVGNTWETLFLNCLEVGDTTNLDRFNAFGEGRWGAIVRKPPVVFSGSVEAVVATTIIIPNARNTQRVNCQLVSPASNDLPLVVAARQLTRIARLANDNPAHDYGSQQANGLIPGADELQWTYPQREQAVLGGSSTIEVVDGIVNIGDVITFYHPTGDTAPAYRFVVDIIKLQNAIFNVDMRFAVPEWDGAPLIPDDQVANLNPSAKRPSMAVAEVAAVIDGLAANAIISDPVSAKKTILAEIDATNPKRLNLTFTIQLSGNTNIKSIDLNFGFFYGGNTIAA